MNTLPQEKPTLYVGHRVPFDGLEPEPFADFVHVSLQEIKRGVWEQFAQPDVGPDGGFDVSATRTADRLTVCIQAKRRKRIDVADIASELAKVAVRSKLDGVKIGEYLLVCTGTVADKIRKHLRQDGKTELAIACSLASKAEAFDRLREAAVENHIDIDEAILAFLKSAVISVWSGDEFDGQLGSIWSRLSDVLARTFVVHALVHEYPRPNFAEPEYLQGKVAVPHLMTLGIHGAALPRNVLAASAGDPMASTTKAQVILEWQQVNDVLSHCGIGSVHLLLAPGGGGKSMSCMSIMAAAARKREADSSAWLPIYLDLAGYRGNLDSELNSALGLSAGSWRALPGPVILLLDGLDQVPRQQLAVLSGELRAVTFAARLTVLITCRSTGPATPFQCSHLGRAWTVAPCTIGNVQSLARTLLDEEQAIAFVDQWLARARVSRYFALPQSVAACARLFRDERVLPASRRHLLEAVVRYRAQVELARERTLPDHLAGVPFQTLRALAGEVAVAVWLRGEVSRWPEELGLRATSQGLLAVKKRGEFGADVLSDTGALSLLLHSGLLIQHQDRSFSFEHDNLAALFASDIIARDWRNYVDSLQCRHGDEVWILAAPHLSPEELPEFLAIVAGADLVLASDCAAEALRPDLMENSVIHAAQAADRLIAISKAARALQRLGTARCLEFLRTKATGTIADARGDWPNAAWHSLALAGDSLALDQLLADVDRMASLPLNMSGGTLEWWTGVQPAAALAAVRRRSATTRAQCRIASIEVLATWGARSDLEIAAELTRGFKDLQLFLKGLAAISRRDKELGGDIVREGIGASGGEERVFLEHAAGQIGLQVDAPWLIGYLLGPEPAAGPRPAPTDYRLPTQQYQGRKLARELLVGLELNPHLGQRALAIIGRPGLAEELRHDAWKIAQAHCPESLAPLALGVLVTGGAAIGEAAQFALTWNFEETDRGAVVVAIEHRLTVPIGDLWAERAQVELLAAWGHRGNAFTYLRARIFALASAPVAAGQAAMRPKMGVIMDLVVWLECATAFVADFFTEQELQHLLLHDLSHSTNAESFIAAACKRLCDGALDHVITGHTEHGMQRKLLAAAARKGSTELRCTVLAQCVRTSCAGYTMENASVLSALADLWSEGVKRMVVELLARGPYSHSSSEQLIGDLVTAVAERLSRVDVELYVKPALANSPDPLGRRVLQFLADVADRAPLTGDSP